MDCVRVLRPGGKVLIATANKDLYDFNPSPHRITLGQTPNGKILLVVHTFRKIDDMEVIRFISSRKATRKEAKEYLRRRK
ncbi:MAG: BrnT family toxin [Deltaproteobacteria bacterium]|nr:BrnT family toxin [Deltaproteobacteria bacterium]